MKRSLNCGHFLKKFLPSLSDESRKFKLSSEWSAGKITPRVFRSYKGGFSLCWFFCCCSVPFKIRLYWGHVAKGAFLHLSLTGQDKIKPTHSWDYCWLHIIHLPWTLCCRDLDKAHMKEESNWCCQLVTGAPLACLRGPGKWMMEIRCQLFTDHMQKNWGCLHIFQLISCVWNIRYLYRNNKIMCKWWWHFNFFCPKTCYVFLHRNLI